MFRGKTNRNILRQVKSKRAVMGTLFVVTTIIMSAVGILVLTPKPIEAEPTGFGYFKLITIESDHVDENLANFPIWVYNISDDFKDTGHGGNIQPDGDDIAFYSYNKQTKYNHEIETYDGSTGEIGIWVNITSIGSTQDTKFWMYYGNPTCSNQENIPSTWDGNYVAVWHMKDNTSSTISDSTANNEGAAKSGANMPNEVNGKLGKGQDYERDGSHYIVADSEVHGVDSDDEITYEAWFKLESTISNGYLPILSHNQGLIGLYTSFKISGTSHPTHPSELYLLMADGSSNYVWVNEQISTGLWYYAATTIDRDSDYSYMYLNGSQKSSLDISGVGDCYDNQGFCGIGTEDQDGGYPHNWDGILDECRISRIDRSAAWINTSFHTMNSPSTFLNFGGQVDVSEISFELNDNKFTHQGSRGDVTYSNSSGPVNETAEFNVTVYGDDKVDYIRINVTDIDENITASNVRLWVSVDNSTWRDFGVFNDGGSSKIIDTDSWTWADDPFPINSSNSPKTIYIRTEVAIPNDVSYGTYTTTSCNWDVGYYS